MLRLHPVIRLASALLIVAAVFFAASITNLVFVYTAVILSLMAARLLVEHLRFVGLVTAPLLIALLLVWGWVMDPVEIPPPHHTGVAYAFFLWLRIVACGGALQFLFLPLVEQPTRLRDFLCRTGLEGSIGTLILTAIIFLPEMSRRLGRIIDARRAQGHALTGLQGLRELPTLLMPLVSTLLDSATKRAELWSHRGLLVRPPNAGREADYSHPLGVLTLSVVLTVCVTVLVT